MASPLSSDVSSKQLEEFIQALMRLRGSAERRKETGEEGEEARRGRGGAPELPRGAETEKTKEREMATGGITTLPASPDDGASGGFPSGDFKDPKRLYCKNGGYFLRINSDGRVDGIREKSDPHSECICSVLSMEKQERGDDLEQTAWTKTLYVEQR